MPTRPKLQVRCWTSSLAGILLSLTVFSGSGRPLGVGQPPAPDRVTPPRENIPATLFGMHIHRAATTTVWPGVPFAEQRLWDAGVTWRELEPKQGVGQWELMDRSVELDQQHKVGVLLDLAMTPRWAASRPSESSPYGDGAASVPISLKDWENHVTAVASRYRGRIHEYELWNEPNFTTFYTGTPKQLLDLARTGYEVIKQVDPTALVISPAFSLEDDGGFRGLEQFLALGGGNYADVVAVHLYVGTGKPEDHVRQVARLRQLMARYRLESKPIWNTEMGWPRSKVFANREEAAGYVARTYLLDWALGIRRVYWYAWDNTVWVSLVMVEEDQKTMTLAARAYASVQEWMIGWQMRACAREGSGVWACEMANGDRTAHILWADDQPLSWRLPEGWHAKTVEELVGKTRPLSGTTLQLGSSPVRVQ